MFSNPVYNLPPQFNENLLAQNLAGLSFNPGQDHQQRQNLDFGTFQFPQQQQVPIDIGGYAPPPVDDANIKWPSPNDVSVTNPTGSTVVRQYNNSMIDDYYKKFLRPITDYVAIPTTGQPTYVYQNLGGQQTTTGAVPIQQTIGGAEGVSNEQHSTISANISQANPDGADEKKHKKKHKKRSSKHGNGESSKYADDEKGTDERKSRTIDNSGQQQVSSVVPGNQADAAARQEPMRHEGNPVVFFDIDIDDDSRGRLVIELFRHVLPRTAQNFLSLCTNEHGFGYRLSYFHRIIPGFMAQGGDFEKSNGTGGYSIYGDKFNDEGFPYPHDRPGLLSMANSGPNTNGSQFFLTFVPCPHLDNKHVVFGQVLQGFHLLKDLELSGSENGDVSREVKIANSGQLQ